MLLGCSLSWVRGAWTRRTNPVHPRAPTWPETPLAPRPQVESLQSKLGRLHGTDLVSLRRAYTSLTQHVSALEGEWAGTVGCATGLQTAVISPELVAREVRRAGRHEG